jgi:hypothetical protein
MGDRTIWHLVADIKTPNPEPFAVMMVDTSIRREGGVEGTVISLHRTREEAEWRALELDEDYMRHVGSPATPSEGA